MSEMGFIGLGSIGLAMAKNLAQDATILRVWNRTASKADALAGETVRRARCPAEAAESGMVVSMVADDRALEEIVGGPEGILAASRPGLHISMSTVSARESGVPMPLASLLHDRLLASIGRGRSDLDWTALAQSVSEEAGLPS